MANSTAEAIMDPHKAVIRWSEWTARGPADDITRVIDQLDANLPAGWKRLTAEDLTPYQPMAKTGSAWYGLDPTSEHPGVALSLERPADEELRGGRVWFPGPRDASGKLMVPAAWDQVIGFLEDGIVPVLKSSRLVVHLPSPEEVFLAELPMEVRHQLEAFSNAARKLLPLDREEAELWRAFVIAAFRSRSTIAGSQLADWLAANGWAKSAACELSQRFFDHCLLLSQYADEVSAA